MHFEQTEMQEFKYVFVVKYSTSERLKAINSYKIEVTR